MAVHNPFRDRAPEKIVSRYFEALRNDQCQTLPPSMFAGKPGDIVSCTPSSSPHHLTDWQLRARQSSGNTVSLSYEVAWGGSSDRYASFDVQLQHFPDGWKIVSADTFY